MWNCVLYNGISYFHWVTVKMSETSTGTLGKLVSLLELISQSEQPLRFMDVVKASQQPRGTVHRQLTHLLAEGLIEQADDQTYVPGLRLLTFASKAWARNDLRTVAAPYLRQLHECTEESVHLALLRDLEVIYLDKIDAKQNVRMHSQLGNSSPAYCTGVGKAALSCLSATDLASRAARFQYHPFTPHTIMSAQALISEIDDIRACGYAQDRQEHEMGIVCVAAPIGFVSQSGTVAAISVTAPSYRIGQEQLAEWINQIISTSGSISLAINAVMSPRL